MITMIIGVGSVSLMIYKTKEKSMKEEKTLHYNQLHKEKQNKLDSVHFDEIRALLMI